MTFIEPGSLCWRRGSKVRCDQGHELPTAGIIEHAVPVCRVSHGDGEGQCGQSVYVVVLSQRPPLYAFVRVTDQQRGYIVGNTLTPLQALWYLQLPMPVEKSA